MTKLIANVKKYRLSMFGFVLLTLLSVPVHAAIDGVSGINFSLTASEGYIDTPDGDSLLVWGYALDAGLMQYPGPTLIVNQGDTVTITLNHDLPFNTGDPVSLVFPGQENVTATGGTAGEITQEALPASPVTYTFTANHAGTYIYHSGSNPEIQIEMGLVGAIIVRPATANQAYSHADSTYDYEYLFLLTEMDPAIHYAVEWGEPVDNTNYNPVLWFINGRNGPDTMADANVPWLPHQPYNILPRVHPGDKALLRFVVAGRDLHPFHTHGNHFRLIARDGRLLESATGLGADLSREDFTLQSVPGATYDAIWNWTGEKMGWDVFGDPKLDATLAHSCSNAACPDTDGNGFHDTTGAACFDQTTREYCPDHGRDFPVITTELQDLTFGGFFSGSPFLGAFGDLPPGEGGLNLNGGMFYMWHSHTEKEIVNNDIFPGGMLTMMIVEPAGVPIE